MRTSTDGAKDLSLLGNLEYYHILFHQLRSNCVLSGVSESRLEILKFDAVAKKMFDGVVDVAIATGFGFVMWDGVTSGKDVA